MSLTNSEIFDIAMQQSAFDSNCCKEDFCRNENIVVLSADSPNARKYLELPFYCDLVSYGNNIVASVDPSENELAEFIKKYIDKYPLARAFEPTQIYILNDELQRKGMKICFMAEYFLPDVDLLKPIEFGYSCKLLEPDDFAELYLPEWGNALCEKRKHLDVLALGAYDGDRLIGLAGCSADCDSMWQIGIDVLPEYRRKGIASALTSGLAIEIINRGKVPFYCAAWSNVKSVRNAIKSGFRPAWVQITAKSLEFIAEMNK